MSAFDTIFGRTAGPALSAHLGEAVTYTPPGGAPLTIPGVLFEEHESSRRLKTESGDQSERTATAVCPQTLDGTPQAYVHGGQFTRGGEEWFVTSAREPTAGYIAVELKISGWKQSRKPPGRL